MPPTSHEKLHGLLVVDKPIGVSSMAVVRKVRWAAGGKNQKVGHAGTLDPLATGVVICCLGEATKCVEALMGLVKIYETTIDLTAFTTTDDREGQRHEVVVTSPPTEKQVHDVVDRFLGVVDQKPPAFSAIHIDGQRAYRLARQGKEVEMPTKQVRIDNIDVIRYCFPLLDLRVTCGRGTYIRSLARDIGKSLGTGGHLASLRRTAVGPYNLEKSVDWQRLDIAPITTDDLLPVPCR